MSEGATVEQEASRIFREWGNIAWVEAVLAILVAFALIAAVKLVVPRLAGWLPERFRFYILPWQPILRLVVLVALALYVAPIFIKPTVENVLAIGGALALAIGFAFKDYASSLLAGVVALYERPYRPGDWVTIEGTYGEVQGLGLRTVKVVTPDDTAVAIPHLNIWTEAIHNANSGQRDLMCVADFYLHPEHDGRLVRRALRDVALSSPYLQLGRPISVIAQEKPWGTHYRLKAYPIESRDQFRFVTELTVRGKALLRRHGVRFSVAPALAGGA